MAARFCTHRLGDYDIVDTDWVLKTLGCHRNTLSRNVLNGTLRIVTALAHQYRFCLECLQQDLKFAKRNGRRAA